MNAGSSTDAIGRNDPCPCGSGKKYKKCCMGKQPAPKTEAASRAVDPLAMARAHHEAGRLQAAAGAYREVLARRPRELAALIGLANVCNQLGEWDGGISLLQRAIKVDGRVAIYHVYMANMLLQAGRTEEAIAAARRANDIEPSGSAWRTVASCHERMHRFDEAADAADRALAIDPKDTDAGIVRGRLHRRAGELDAACSLLESIIARDDGRRVLTAARFELGMALDRRADYDAAYEAFAACGAEKATGIAARDLDRDQWFRIVADYREHFDGALIERWPPFDDGHPVPAFLVGFPRSGTTMTEQILAAHPRVATAGEEPLLRGVLDEMRATTGAATNVAALRALSREEALRLRGIYWQAVTDLLGGPVEEGLFLDKLPLNLIHLGAVNALFPEARVIVALRDPRDVCLSCFMQDFRLNAAMVNFLELERTAMFYATVMDLWLQQRSLLTVPFIEIRYEDTVGDLEGQGRRVLEHLGLEWSDDLLAFHEKARARNISTPSYAAVTEKIHTRAVGRWRNYERHFARALPHLERFVEAFGYESGGA